MKKVVYALVAALAASVVQAGPTADFAKSVLGKSAAATPGRWNSNFDKCKKYCDDNGVPFVAVWSNGDACGHCTAFEKACEKSYFKNWQKKSGIVFWFGYPGNGYKMDDAVAAFKWTRANSGRQSYTSGGPQTAFPFVRIYWPKGRVDISTVGDTMRGGFSSNADTSAKKITQFIDGKLKVGKAGGWTPAGETPKYLGGVFDPKIDNVEGARMEIETGLTTSVTIHLVRTNANSVAYTATNFLHAAGSTLEGGQKEIFWDGGEAAIDVAIPVSEKGTDNLVLTLYDKDNKTLKDTFTVTRVKAKDNSPENPLFVGKESEGLGWGQWSMDLDKVTNKVATANGGLTSGKPRLGVSPAYAAVLFGGAMWCPDCAKSDEYFFKSTEFKNWAVDNKIALGVVDIPNLPNQTNSPCLLTTISATTGAGNFHGYSKRSGLDYLTRHMISADEAQVVYDRNVQLASHNVLNGGWNRPERANQNRPGVPILLLLRGDGSIAGRFTALASVSPTSAANNAAYIKRLNELLEQAKDDSEESSDGVKTTTGLEASRRSENNGSISCNDERDIYRIGADSAGLRLQMRFTAADAVNNDAVVDCSVINSNGTTMATAKGVIGEGVTLDYTVPTEGEYFVQIAQGFHQETVNGRAVSVLDSQIFNATNPASSVVKYTLETDFVLVPRERRDEREGVGDNMVKMYLEEGEEYFFDGTVNAASMTDVFEEAGLNAASKPIYRSKVTGVVDVSIPGTTVVYQKWRCGAVGFGAKAATVSESTKQFDIQVVRTGGVSGTAEYKVQYVGAFRNGSPCDFDRDTLLKAEWDLDAGTVLSWGDGEGDAKTVTVTVVDNQFADGTVSYRFVGTTVGGDATEDEEKKNFSLNVKDNDRKVPGVLAIADDAPEFSKTRTITAKENSTISLLVKREGGADGDFSAKLKTSAGQFEGGVAETTHDWGSRDDGAWSVDLTLPSRATAKSVTVDLSPATSATKVKTAAKRLTITVLPGTVPEFVNVGANVDAFCNVTLSKEVARARTGTYSNPANLKYKKVSGALPAGLSAVADEDNPGKLYVVGTPTKKGTSTAVYRIFDGDVGGTTVSVTVSVGDPTKDTFYAADADLDTPRAVVPNPAMSAGKTYYDIMVKDGGHLMGLVTLSLPANGKASAKYRSANGTVSLSAKSWYEFDPETGIAEAYLKGTGTAADYRLYAKVKPDGTFAILELTDPEAGKTYSDLEAFGGWTKARPATDYKGYYTVSLPGVGSAGPNNETQIIDGDPLALGDGYMTLKMDTAAAMNQGKFAYAGLLPNGKAVSGSAILTPLYSGAATNETHTYWGVVPFVNVSDTDVFTGAVKVRPRTAFAGVEDGATKDGAYYTGCREGEYCGYDIIRRSVYQYEAAKPLWQHSELNYDPADEDKVCYDVELDAFGTYYNAKENFKSVFDNSLQANVFFHVLGGGTWGLVDTKYGDFAGWDPAKLGVKVATTVDKKGVVTANAITLVNATNPRALTFSFASATGIVTGKFKLPMEFGDVTVNYKAIVLPGFGNSGCDCGLDFSDAKNRPFISGTAWFDDDGSFDYTYGPKANKQKMLKVRRSCPVSVGTEAGK